MKEHRAGGHPDPELFADFMFGLDDGYGGIVIVDGPPPDPRPYFEFEEEVLGPSRSVHLLSDP